TDGGAIVPIPGGRIVQSDTEGQDIVDGIRVQPAPLWIGNDVVTHGDISRAFIQVDPDASVIVENVVLGNHRAGTGGQVVDRSAIVKVFLGAMDPVVSDIHVAVSRRRVVNQVCGEVIAPEVESVVRIAMGVLDSPAISDIDGVVRNIRHLVVKDH